MSLILHWVNELEASNDIQGLDVLERILTTLRDNPGDPRYRRLRLGCSTRLREALKNPSSIRLLQHIGFHHDPLGDLILSIRDISRGEHIVIEALQALRVSRHALENKTKLSTIATLAKLPPEPQQGAAGSTYVTVVLHLGNGKEQTLHRRFDAADKLSDVLMFVIISMIQKSKISSIDGGLSSFRRVSDHSQYPPQLLHVEDRGLTLQALGMWPSCRLVIEMPLEEDRRIRSIGGSSGKDDKTKFSQKSHAPTFSMKKPRPSSILNKHLARFDHSDKLDRGREHQAVKVK